MASPLPSVQKPAFPRLLSLCLIACLAGCAGSQQNLFAPSAADSSNSGDSSGQSSGDSSNSGNSSGQSSAGSGDSSGNSGASSANSSQDSNQSSAGSNQSSANSAESSKSVESMNNSSGPGGSSDVNASSRNSTGATSRESQNSVVAVSASALLLSTVVGIGVAIYGTYRAGKDTGPQTQSQAQAAMLYFRAREHQFKQDLALGAGPTLDDLAAAAEIRKENHRRFTRVLQQNRRELLSLARAQALTPQRALRLLERIGELARNDEVLHQDYQAFVRRHPEAG